MHWIRKNSRFGAWAAVFALAIQLVLSFGHVHLDNLQGTSSVTASASQRQPNTPAADDRGTGHDFCAICAALNHASSSVLPTVVLPTTGVDHPYTWAGALQFAQ